MRRDAFMDFLNAGILRTQSAGLAQARGHRSAAGSPSRPAEQTRLRFAVLGTQRTSIFLDAPIAIRRCPQTEGEALQTGTELRNSRAGR